MDTIRHQEISSLEALKRAMVARKEMMVRLVTDSERLGILEYTVAWDGEEHGKSWTVAMEGERVFMTQEYRDEDLMTTQIGTAMRGGKCWLARKGMVPKAEEKTLT